MPADFDSRTRTRGGLRLRKRGSNFLERGPVRVALGDSVNVLASSKLRGKSKALGFFVCSNKTRRVSCLSSALGEVGTGPLFASAAGRYGSAP